MWNYESRLQYPVNIKKCDLHAAKVIMSQFGGPDGELAAAMRYLSQRYVQPYKEVCAILTDIGTEELAHVEIINAILYQSMRGASVEDIKAAGLDTYFVDHTLGQWPQSAGGVPFTATYLQSKGDPICDLHEDLAAEQKARVTYDNILRLVDNPDICDPIRYLREREVVHYQRFGEALRITQDNLNAKNFYYINPAYDLSCKRSCEKPCTKPCNTTCNKPCEKVMDKVVCSKPCEKVMDKVVYSKPCEKPCEMKYERPCEKPCEMKYERPCSNPCNMNYEKPCQKPCNKGCRRNCQKCCQKCDIE